MKERESLALERARLSGDATYVVNALRDPTTRGLAAKYAAEMGATEAVPDLRRMLGAHETYVRSAAAAALGRLRAREAVDDLQQVARTDAAPVVRAWAAGALGNIAGADAVKVLTGLLNDESWVVRRAATFGLGLAGDPSALPALEAAARRERWTRRRVYRQARRQLWR